MRDADAGRGGDRKRRKIAARRSNGVTPRARPARRKLLTLGIVAAATAAIGAASPGGKRLLNRDTQQPVGPAVPTDIGINLFGIAPYNRQQVFTNLIAQSEWFASQGAGWTALPHDQVDARGWVRFLRAGQFAPRPLVLPPAPFITLAVRCTFAGRGRLSAGGVARLVAERPSSVDIMLTSEGRADEGGWIQLEQTDPADPLRDVDCRDRALPQDQLFHPAFVASLRGFSAVRFLDWQRVNDNPVSIWETRTLPDASSQAGPGGVAVEHMVALANEASVDPWFIMPYNAEEDYIARFARYVHANLAPGRTAYVELGNEIWNDMFAAARQAREEGLAAGLAPKDDPFRAQMRRYAQKSRAALRIWTGVFADRPTRLVRVISTQNVYPDLAEMVFDYEDTARWTDALATAPYITLDLNGRGAGDVDWVYSRLDAAVDETIDFAARNKAIAARHGKRFITYEGGQHLVTRDMALAHRIQRDPRMAAIYTRYLERWRDRIGDRMMLYASTAPIGDYGAWGLTEYAGQPAADAPKLRAVRAFLGGAR
ncbi:hypothetical protein M0208_13560 [Sphingomonas sp. SUN019]|uniref:hypothetical protein n=1 Tax=Sphingomonas sp. SUN019 TaxID=2937788 RepID=UPI002164540C|nr:hypothetical protein [Sphingomonas sp. SUN019]UVO51480.1 hypothetical protein M0208_13560 [Sphingomonas sp. SUN019]